MQKRKLGFWEIWNMSFGFLGIQVGFALQNANVSRIFQIFALMLNGVSFMNTLLLVVKVDDVDDELQTAIND